MPANQRQGVPSVVRQRGRMIGVNGCDLGVCVMTDVSSAGARLFVEPLSDLPDRFTLVLSRNGQLRRECIVVWRENNAIGVRFAPRPLAKQLQFVQQASKFLNTPSS